MKATAPQTELNNALKSVGKSVGSGSTLPILSGVHVSASDDGLTLKGTDLESTVQAHVEAEVKTPGECVVSYQTLSQAVGKLNADIELSVDESGEKLSLEGGDSHFEFLLLPLEDWPDIAQKPEGVPALVYDREALVGAIDKTCFAALSAKETSRLNLTGVYFDFADQTKLVATNGYRLALQPIDYSVAETPEDILVDADTLKGFGSILRSLDEDNVQLATSDDHAFIVCGEYTLGARLIQEEYPDYERVIPSDNSIGVRVNRESLLHALERVSITTAKESGAVVLEAKGDSVQVSAQSSEKGNSYESVPLLKSADEVTISFRGEYVIDALRHCDQDEVTVWLKDGESAGLVEASEYINVVMPIRAS